MNIASIFRPGLLSLSVAIASIMYHQNSFSETIEPRDPNTPDIIAEFVGGASVDQNLGEISFRLNISNVGASMVGAREMSYKVLLVANRDYSKSSSSTGFVFDTLKTNVNLKNGEQVETQVTAKLPTIPAGEYFLAVTFNTKMGVSPKGEGVDESYENQRNNVTPQMINLGSLPANVGPARSGTYDLYHEVARAFFTINGYTASHQSRNILRVMEGSAPIPERSTWNDDITARFLYFDLDNAKAYVGAYTDFDLDKRWRAINWHTEADSTNRVQYVDYYSNAPRIDHLPPGKYVLGVLMNINDDFSLDSYPENNLDLTYLDLSAKRVMNLPSEVWTNGGSENEEALVEVSVFDRADLYEWSYTIDAQPWLSVRESNNNYRYSLHLKVDWNLAPGDRAYLDIPVTITARARDGRLYPATTTVHFRNPRDESREFMQQR